MDGNELREERGGVECSYRAPLGSIFGDVAKRQLSMRLADVWFSTQRVFYRSSSLHSYETD